MCGRFGFFELKYFLDLLRQLTERYDTPPPKLVEEVDALAAKVDGHLRKMGINL